MPMGDLAAPQAFGTGSPGELAQQPSAASLLGQLFGSIQQAPETPPQVVYPTKNPLTAITDKDINRGIDIGLGFSGGGLGIKAYHGSPHSFERFDASKIGTGEGAQSYGHGLYFAEHEPTAKYYREALTRAVPTVNGRVQAAGPGKFNVVDDFGIQAGPFPTLEEARASMTRQPGHMYEVDINADPSHLLDWDATLGSQPKAVQKAFAKQLEQFGPEARMAAQMKIAGSRHPQGLRGVTQDLVAQGVPGIKYLDQGSRGLSNVDELRQSIANVQATLAKNPENKNAADLLQTYQAQLADAQKATSNYVVFDPDLINITRKYGLLGAPAMGALAAQNYTLPQEGQ
jgi:hypothetical protein